ncbi:MAG: ABC transporter permease [Bacillota bacterium]|jgi:osmoprotectant transport system permease protein|nr:ABC transporter permease [Clostridia bacterium]
MSYFQKNLDTIIGYTQSHFELVFLAVFISLILWVPIGIMMTRNDKAALSIMGIANSIFCIPSLSLFAVFVVIPYLGLGRRSALVALILYSMMPLLGNVYRGIKLVDKTVIEAAKGMGMSARRILFEIQLPLAAPVIFAGLRTTVVMTTGIAAIAPYIGERNLGSIIIIGLAQPNLDMIVTGSILISLVAILLDTVMGFFEKKVIPKGIRISQGR